jgi:hypothetical protein
MWVRPRRRLALTTLVAAGALATVAAPKGALADGNEKAACIAASDEAQQLKLDGKLTLARTRLLACARAECPAIVKQDCGQWLAEVDAALPTVVFGARDAEGRDLFAVRVLEDGVMVADHLDGRARPVDPGPHLFRFETAAVGAVEVRVLARAGERNRAITASFPTSPGIRSAPATPTERPAAPPSIHAPPAGSTPPSPSGAGSAATPSPIAWVAGGVALVALGTALYFEVAQVSDYNHLSSSCAGHCPPDQVDHVGTERWIAGVSAGIGVVAAGLATYFFLSRPHASAATGDGAGVAFDVAPLVHGGAATLTAHF